MKGRGATQFLASINDAAATVCLQTVGSKNLTNSFASHMQFLAYRAYRKVALAEIDDLTPFVVVTRVRRRHSQFL